MRFSVSDNLKKLLIIILVIAAVLAAYFPVIIWLTREWLYNPYYGHGFLVPLLSAAIMWYRRPYFTLEHSRYRYLLLIGAGLAVNLAGFIVNDPFLSSLSLPVVVLGITMYATSGNEGKMVFASLLLYLMIPMPFISGLTALLQSFTAWSVVKIVLLSGLTVQSSGTLVYLPDASVTIGPACSGIYSLVSLLFISIVITFIVHGPTLKKTVFVLLSLTVAIISNILRIVSVIAVAYQFGIDTATSYFHDLSGILFFIVSLLLLLLLTKMFRFRFRSFTSMKHGVTMKVIE